MSDIEESEDDEEVRELDDSSDEERWIWLQ